MIWQKKPGKQPSFEDSLLSALSVTFALPPDGDGMWVYGLRNAAGETFYVGKSGNILTRLGAHRKTYRDTLVKVWLVPCASEWAMTTTEDLLIDRLQPVMNVHGMSDEAERVKARIARKSERQKAVQQGLRDAGLPVFGAAR